LTPPKQFLKIDPQKQDFCHGKTTPTPTTTTISSCCFD
jgi:hypothetical protein